MYNCHKAENYCVAALMLSLFLLLLPHISFQTHRSAAGRAATLFGGRLRVGGGESFGLSAVVGARGRSRSHDDADAWSAATKHGRRRHRRRRRCLPSRGGESSQRCRCPRRRRHRRQPAAAAAARRRRAYARAERAHVPTKTKGRETFQKEKNSS